MPTDNKIIDALFRSAAYIDVETTGLSRDASIHQLSVVNLANKSAVEYIPNPYRLITRGPLDSEPLRGAIGEIASRSSWSEVVKEVGGSWLQQHAASYPHLQDNFKTPADRTATLGDMAVNVKTKTGMSIGAINTDIFKNIGDNQVVWIANAPFEAEKLGTIGNITGTTETIREQLTYAPRSTNNVLYVNDPSVLAAKSKAIATGDWSGVWDTIASLDLNRPGKKVLDPLDVVRAAQSYGSKVASTLKLDFDVQHHADQVGLNVQSRIMGLGPELHTATEDNLLSAIVGKQSATNIGAFKDMLERAHMATGAALKVKTPEEANAMNWLWRQSKLKTVAGRQHMKYSSIARALYDIEYGSGQHVFTVGHEEVTVPQWEMNRSGKRMPTTATIAMPRRDTFTSMDEYLSFLSTTSRANNLDVYRLAGEVREEIKAGGSIRLQELIETGASRAVETELDAVENSVRYKMGDVVGNIFSSGQTKTASAIMGSKLGMTLAGIGIAGAALGITSGIFRSIPSKDDAYNTITGMQEDNYASYLRETNTDFGSPYGGLSNSISLYMLNGGMSQTPTYVNNIPIDQQIANFRDQMLQTPLQKQMIKQAFAKQELEGLNRLYFLDPALTTPLASANYGLVNTEVTSMGDMGTEALVKSKNLQVLDISRENWAVEDADTIILKKGVRGLMGQEIQVRLAGIDAPEVEHSGEEAEWLRYKQGQPHGSESRWALQAMLDEAHDIKLVLDPTADTYGRSLGVLIADGKNVNLEMVRRGQAAALPFGEETSDIINRDIVMSHEQLAYENNRGMWADDYWRTYRNAVGQRNRITFNTLASMDKLAGNMNLAALESTMTLSREPGYSQLVDKSIPYLNRKLSSFGKKKHYTEIIVPASYQAKQEHLDQLKIETSRHMKTTGNLLGDTRMATRGHQYGNVSFAIDSLERSSSIYHSRLPAIIDKYEKKVATRRVQGAVQRQANADMMFDQNIVRM